MLALYLFTLVLGGGFLSLAIFGDLFGGHADGGFDSHLGGMDGHLELGAGHVDVDLVGLDADVGGLDVDAGGMELDAGHLDMDAHLDAGAGHTDLETTHDQLQADAGSLASKIFSIRNLFYSMFGFGAMGTILTYSWTGNPFLTAGISVISGIASGSIVNAAFGFVKRTESGMLQSEVSYEGLAGRVTLPIKWETAGKVVVERGGRSVELRAFPHASAAGKSDPTTWKRVFVVEMVRGVARVAPVEEDMLLEP